MTNHCRENRPDLGPLHAGDWARFNWLPTQSRPNPLAIHHSEVTVPGLWKVSIPRFLSWIQPGLHYPCP